MTGVSPGACPECHRPRTTCTCRRVAMLVEDHTDAEPEFRGRARLIGIDVDDIQVGDVLTTGEDIEVAWARYCNAPGCGLKAIDRDVIEDHIARLRPRTPKPRPAWRDVLDEARRQPPPQPRTRWRDLAAGLSDPRRKPSPGGDVAANGED